MARRRRRRPPGGHARAAGCRGRCAPFSADTASHTHTDCSLAPPPTRLLLLGAPILQRHFQSDSAPSSFPCARPLLPSSDRSAGQRKQPSHSTVLARPVCPFVYVSAASFPCRFSDLGLNFLLASAFCTRAHTLSLDTFSRPSAGKPSSPAGLSTLVYAYVVDRAPASPYTCSSSTHRFPDERTPIEAKPLSATSADLGLSLGLSLGLGSLAHFTSHALPLEDRSRCGQNAQHSRPLLTIFRVGRWASVFVSLPHFRLCFRLRVCLRYLHTVQSLWTRGGQSGGVTDQPQCRRLWHSSRPSARSLTRSPLFPPSLFHTISLSPA